MDIGRVFKYIFKIAPSISYWKIIICSLFMILVYEGILMLYNRGKLRWEWMSRIKLYSLILYTNFVLRLTLFGREIGSKRIAEIRLNLSAADLFSNHGILNIILFVPFGFLLYAVLKNYSVPIRLVLTTLLSIILTLLIEVIQLATYSGRFEVADIAANAIGGLIGAVAACIILDSIHT